MGKNLVWIGVPVVLGLAAAFVLFARAGGAKESNVPVDKRLVSANTEFGFRLLKELVAESKAKNVFISPAGVSLALSMTYNGASGETKTAMASALALNGMTLDDLNNAGAALLDNLEGPGPGVKLSIANSLWARKDITFKPDFMDRNKRYYKAEVSALDFTDAGAVGTINSWVSDNTGGKIRDIIDRIDPLTILFLINAVYFKGTWSDRFDPANTRPADFTLLDGSKKKVQMMSRHGKYTYFRGDGFEAVNIPYGEGRVSVYVLLPDRTSSLAAVLKKLDTASWDTWMGEFHQRELDLYLPRFKIGYGSELRDALTALGMGIAFSGGAGFAAMTPEDVFIKSVMHKTFVEVNEEGTEAAAATKVEMTLKAVPVKFEFHVDRPFFCAIRDNKTGEILFVGAIVEPM